MTTGSAAGTGSTSISTVGTITSGIWNGSLVALAYGGTNANLTASNGGIFYSTGSAGAILGGTATANQVLLSGSSTTPAWSTATYPATTTINQLLYSSSANTIAGLATANSASLVTNSSGVPSWSGTMTNGQLIIGSTGATPTAATLTAGTGITITNAAGSITIANNGAASGTSLSQSIHQVSHGFSVQQIIYLNGSTYTLAEANSASTAEVVGIVTAVADADHFTITYSGYITGLSGLTAGTVYFLSDATPGLLTATEPSTVGNISKPLFVADATTSGYFHNFRGKTIPTTITYPLSLANGGTNANLTAANNNIVYSNASAFALLATANSAVLTTSSSGALTWSGTMTNGQLIIGSTSATPTAATLTAGVGVQITNGAASITLASTGTSINTQTASYGLVLSDAGKIVEMNVAGANNLTVPLNATQAFAVGTIIDIVQFGAGKTTVVATGGVTIESLAGNLSLNGQYAGATLYKRGTDDWVLLGNLTT